MAQQKQALAQPTHELNLELIIVPEMMPAKIPKNQVLFNILKNRFCASLKSTNRKDSKVQDVCLYWIYVHVAAMVGLFVCL